MRRLIVRISLIVAAVCGLGAAAAVPAMAASSPVTASVQVSQSITLTLDESSFSISGLAGTTATAAAPVVYHIVTGDPSGYTVTDTPSGDLADGHGHTIPFSDMAVNNGLMIPMNETGPTTVLTSTVATPPGGQTITDMWQVAIPASAATGTFTTTVTYTAIAS